MAAVAIQALEHNCGGCAGRAIHLKVGIYIGGEA